MRFFDGAAFANRQRGLRVQLPRKHFQAPQGLDRHRRHLRLKPADPAALRATADGILKIRNENIRLHALRRQHLQEPDPRRASRPVRDRFPQSVIREGKVPSAYFLEQVGAKGMAIGDIRVADYHANLIYNAAAGTAAQRAGTDRAS